MTVQELVKAAQKLSLSDQMQLVSQLMQLVTQKLPFPGQTAEDVTPLNIEDDPIVGMFAGAPNLSTEAKDILTQEICSPSGLTWKE